MWMAGVVRPCLVVEPGGLGAERLAVPAASRVPHPGWLWIGGQRVIVPEDNLPERRPRFVEDDDGGGELNDLLREGYPIHTWKPRWHAEAFGIVLAVVVPAFCVERL